MDWSFLDVFWAICIFFAWVFFFWLLITVFSDLFRRHDIGGGAKTLWASSSSSCRSWACSST